MTDLILRPNGDDTAVLSPSSGTVNYAMVDEVTADDNTTYLYGNGTDYYDLQDHTSEAGAITNVRIHARLRNYNAMIPLAYIRIKIGITTYGDTTAMSPAGATYEDFYWDQATNPNTSSAWTWTDIDNLIIGVKENSVLGSTYITQMYVTVTYTAALTVDDSIPAYLKGVDTTNDSQSAYLEGTNGYWREEESEVIDDLDNYVVDDSSVQVVVDRLLLCHNIPAYLLGGSAGTDVDSSISAYLEGGGTNADDSQPAYLKGKDTDLDSIPAYLRGSLDTTTSVEAYIHGSVDADSSIAAYLTGPILVTDSIPAYLVGVPDVKSSISAYLLGTEPVLVNSSIPAYMEGDGTWPFSDDFTGSDGDNWNNAKWVTSMIDD